MELVEGVSVTEAELCTIVCVEREARDGEKQTDELKAFKCVYK